MEVQMHQLQHVLDFMAAHFALLELVAGSDGTVAADAAVSDPLF